MSEINCAIYVRKSTEKGLELQFNSLHNQEESCRNYILSQAFNNWKYYKTYTDGGISGGTMERPALQEMLNDIQNGKVQIVVVYKVDRLSRSIMDFHNMMKEFEKYNCHFVSITQAFDTSTSMGKLTLNMLLSFAQFEREVSSERVRDKLHAQKTKGLWTGGMPVLGYDIVDKNLIPNEEESKTIQHIFESYLSCGSLNQLTNYLNEGGICNKKWITQKGEVKGGGKLISATVYRILRDKIYIGKIEHKAINQIYNGRHKAIIDINLFNQVQEKLTNQNNCHAKRGRVSDNLLSGKLFSADGQKYKNQITRKNPSNVKRYYAIKGDYLAAPQIEDIAKEVVQDAFNISSDILNDKIIIKQINFNDLDYFKKTKCIQTMIKKVIYQKDKLTFFISNDTDELKEFTSDDYLNPNNTFTDCHIDKTHNQIIIEKHVFIQKGLASNTYNAGKVGIVNIQDNNHLTTRAFAYAYKYKNMYESGISIGDIVAQEKIGQRTVYKYLNLAYLSPKIVNDLMNGKKQINIQTLFQIASKCKTFEEQEKEFYD